MEQRKWGNEKKTSEQLKEKGGKKNKSLYARTELHGWPWLACGCYGSMRRPVKETVLKGEKVNGVVSHKKPTEGVSSWQGHFYLQKIQTKRWY